MTDELSGWLWIAGGAGVTLVLGAALLCWIARELHGQRHDAAHARQHAPESQGAAPAPEDRDSQSGG